jgi:hypothetical protein
MRFNLRAMLIFATIVPPVLAVLIWVALWNIFPELRDRPRDARSRKATEDFRQLLLSATELQILEAGDAFSLREKSFHGQSLKRLADAVAIVDVKVTNIPSTVVVDAYITFRLLKDDNVLGEYTYRYTNYFVDASSTNNPQGHWTILTMSEKFSRAFIHELTTMK